MKRNKFAIGKKVWYYPILGEHDRKEAVITGGPYDMCGTTCCNIDIISSIVDIENIEERITTKGK